MSESKKNYGEEFKEKFRTRATLVKEAKGLIDQKEFAQSAYKLQEYLSVLARYHDVAIIDLSPNHFDQKREVAEILMITQVTWELLKIYERVPKLQLQYKNCLDLFVRFSLNQPFQYFNSELLRRYLRKSKAEDRGLLRAAQRELHLKSRKCFIATYCFGSEQLITNNLRTFKFRIQKYPGALWGIEQYYQYSPRLIEYMDNHPKVRKISLPLIKAILVLFEKIIRK